MNVRNLVQGVNTWAVSLLGYSAAFINCRKCELQAIDRKTRKFITIYEGLHPKSDVDRLHADCRLCKKADESIDHFVSGCNKLAQREDKRRHDNLGKIVHGKV